MTLGEYLNFAASLRGRWGAHDCCTFGAQWIIICGYPDPMAHLRGTYDSNIGGLRLLETSGGLLALVADGMARAGVPRYDGDEPQEGDVAVIEREGIDVGAIYTGARWATLLEAGGLSFVPEAPVRGLWRPDRG